MSCEHLNKDGSCGYKPHLVCDEWLKWAIYKDSEPNKNYKKYPHLGYDASEFCRKVEKLQKRADTAEAKLKEKELTSICVYCGAKLISKSIDTKMNDVIEHMAECEKHPVPILLDKLANIEQWFLDHKEHSLEIHNGWARLSNEGMFDLGNNEHFNKKITELEAQVEKMKKAIAIRDRIME